MVVIVVIHRCVDCRAVSILIFVNERRNLVILTLILIPVVVRLFVLGLNGTEGSRWRSRRIACA